MKRATDRTANLHADLLHVWCDGLLARQISSIDDPTLHGGLLCPACGSIHGRCGDALYPFLGMAHTTGDPKYLHAALDVYNWTERNVSRIDGSWINDVRLNSWQGITVFHTIALAEALHHHGEVLTAATRRVWTQRLVRAVKFLDGFITVETGNINYPITACYCFALCGELLADSRYTQRGRALAQQTLAYLTSNHLLFGEGHPQTGVSPQGCRAVDLGYNVEESLPALALYASLTNDQKILEQTVVALRSHLAFMLPDGAWDNSWGTRNYKWSYWGSRTSDGCQPAFVALAAHDPRFLEAAYRNLELMAACTHNGLLYGGPDYFVHGDAPCIHHTFTHAKALLTSLDLRAVALRPSPRVSIPRDEPHGLQHFPEIATYLAATGDWRATVTGYDWNYVQNVAPTDANSGGHVSGGALSFLYHQTLGPVLTASMTEYQLIESTNQQVHLDTPHMPLTPRIEYSDAGTTSSSLNDFTAELSAVNSPSQILLTARGRLLTVAHQPPKDGNLDYHLAYNITPEAFEVVAKTSASAARFILPVISRAGERVEHPVPQTVRIVKAKGILTVQTTAVPGFEAPPPERTFNLVPGFECIPLTLSLQANQEIRIRFQAEAR